MRVGSISFFILIRASNTIGPQLQRERTGDTLMLLMRDRVVCYVVGVSDSTFQCVFFLSLSVSFHNGAKAN